MDITNAVVNFQQATLASQVQMAVAKKMLDSQRMDGASALKLLQAASQTADQGGDELVAAATGLGANLDTYA